MGIPPTNYWTDLRKDLRSWFWNNAPSLGELYEGALEMVFRENFPGRVRFVAHAVREIRNRLPDFIAGPKTGGPLQYKNRLDNIAQIWKRYGLPLDGSLPIKVNESDPLPSISEVPTPLPVYEAVANLVKDHVVTRETPRDSARRLFGVIDPNNTESEAALRPRVEHWIKHTEWFVRRAHDRGETDSEMGGDELKNRFETFESALSAMGREFFKTVEEMDAILEEANS